MNFIITIMPDYGFGPYAWEKRITNESPYVGICIGTSYGFEANGGERLSHELETAFNNWTAEFAQFADSSDFNWTAFHVRGLELSRQLKLAVGDNYKVVYCKPHEDPNQTIDEYTEIK